MEIIRLLIPNVEFFCYVDNIIALIPPTPNHSADEKTGNLRFNAFLNLLVDELGIPLHDIESPRLKLKIV